MRVLVLDGNENQAVACVRSLSRAGHRVTVGSDARWAKAAWSRHAAGSFRYPAPSSDPEGFLAAVQREAEREPGSFVLPLTEASTLLVSSGREALSRRGARYVLPAHEALLRAFNKAETTRLASDVGLVIPCTRVLESTADAREFAATAVYPVVLKPRSSEELAAGRGTVAMGAPVYARSSEECVAAYERIARRGSAAVLGQEYVEGHGAGYFVLMRHAEPVLEFQHRRLRDVRPTGSGSALRVSVPIDERMRQGALALLRALDWHGVAMVEFRVRQDGTPVFLEVNGRFWNSLALAVYAGADFPAAMLELAESGAVRPRAPYRVGVRCRWPLGDARHLLAVMRGAPAGFVGQFPRRGRTLVEVLTPVRGTYHDNFELNDPLPELVDWMDFLTRRVPRALRRGR